MSAAKVLQAQQRWAPLRKTLVDMNARCMEQVIDRQHGVIFERWWLPASGQSLIVHATPDGWDAFKPVSNSNRIDDTLSAVERLEIPSEKQP